LNPKNKVIVRTPELQKKHNQFKKKWNESKTVAFKRREDREIEKKTVELLEKNLAERTKILNKLTEDERNKIKNKIQELLKNKEDETITKISKELLNQDEEIRNKKLLQIDENKRDKIKIKMKEIIKNEEKDKKKPSFFETNSFELLNTLNVIEDSVESSLVDLDTVNTKIIDNFRTTMKDRIEQDRIIEEKKKKIIPYGWNISTFDNKYFYVFNLDFNNFKKKFDSIELDDVYLNENNLVEKLKIEDTTHKIIHDEEIVKYKNNVLITDNKNLEDIKFDKLQFIGKNLIIDNNNDLKTIKLSKLKSIKNIEIEDNSNLIEINLSSLQSVQKLLIKGNNIIKLDIRNLKEVKSFGDYLGGIQININAKVILNKKTFDYYNSYYNQIKNNPSLDKNNFNIITNWTKNAEIIDEKKTIESEEDNIKGGIFSNFSFNYFTNYKQETINKLNQNIINKAILIESVYYSFFNQKNYDLTKIFLEQKNLQYFDIDTELSISESSVLVNTNNKDIIIVYRGSIIKNNQDLLVDVTFSIDYKNIKSYFTKYEEQIKQVQNKYSKLPIELIGHSKGHYIAYTMGDKFSINTTGFNGTFGKNIIDFDKSNKKPIHNFYRITDDIASYNISLKTLINYKITKLNIGTYDKKINNLTKKQWNIYNLHPLQSSITYLETHYINNFVDNSPRKNISSIEESKSKIKNKKDLEKLENNLKNSLLYNSTLPSTTLNDNNKILFSFDKYNLILKNSKISLYSKTQKKIYTKNEFIKLAKKKTLEDNFNKMKQLKIIELKQQGWTIITKNIDFYKHESKETLFDSTIYKLYKEDNGIYSLYNKYTHNIVSIEQAISESKTWLEKLGEAFDFFFYIKDDGYIPYRQSTFWFLTFMIPCVLYLFENIIIIILNFITTNFYNFIINAIETDILSNNLKKLILQISNLELIIINLDDWILSPVFYFFLLNIFIIFKIFINNKIFNTVLITYIIIVLIFGAARSSIIYTTGPVKYYFPV
tara:strand:+ start:2068 stop:5055 length:2988 start_codon:yes stop_codon:yes gene_type:complete